MIMRVPAGRPHFNQSPNPRGTQELKLLIENLLIPPQVKLTSDEANFAKAAVTVKKNGPTG